MQFEHLCMGCMSEKGISADCPYCSWKETSTPASPYHLPPRTLLNQQYLVGMVISQGKFGITYLAYDIEAKEKRVIKEFLPKDIISRFPGNANIVINDIEYQPDFSYSLSKFSEETAVLQRIHPQPGLAHTFDFFRENSTAYRVMEFVDGITLSEYLQQHGGSLSFSQIIKILTPLMTALEKIHARGLLHFDIYPGNILIDKNGVGKLINFSGTNYVVARRWKILRSIIRQGYSSQELSNNINASGPWSDIYSLAATLYRGLTGQIVPDSIARMKHDTLVPPSQFNRELSPDVGKHIVRALSVHPSERFQSMRSFKEAILKTWYEKERRTESEAIDPFKKVHCSFCETANEVLTTDLEAGTATCFGCHRPLTVDGVEERIEGRTAPPSKRKKAKIPKGSQKAFKTKRKPPLPIDSFAKIKCSTCDAVNEVLTSDLGTVATCLVCGTKLDKPLDAPEIATTPRPPLVDQDTAPDEVLAPFDSKEAPPAVPSFPDEVPEAPAEASAKQTTIPRIDKTQHLAGEPAMGPDELAPEDESVEASAEPVEKEDAVLTDFPDAPVTEEKVAPPSDDDIGEIKEDLSDISIPDRVFDLLQSASPKKKGDTDPDAEPARRATPADSKMPDHIFDRLSDENAPELTEDVLPEDILPSIEETLAATEAPEETMTAPEAPAIDIEETEKFVEEPPTVIEQPQENNTFPAVEPAVVDIPEDDLTDIIPEDKPAEAEAYSESIPCPICNAINEYLSTQKDQAIECKNCRRKFLPSAISEQESVLPEAPPDTYVFEEPGKSLGRRIAVVASAVILVLIVGIFVMNYFNNKAEQAALYTQFVQDGDISFNDGRFMEAIRSYQSALAIQPDDTSLTRKITVSQNHLSDLEAVLEAEQMSFLAKLESADSLFEIKQYSDARSIYEGLLTDAPDDPYIADKLDELNQLLAQKTSRPARKTPPPPRTKTVAASSRDNLQSLIDRSPTNSTINLAQGIYTLNEPLIIKKSVHLKGAGPNHTLIIGDNISSVISVKEGVRFTLSGVGFEYQGKKATNIIRVTGATVNISQCSFKDARYSKDDQTSGSALYFKGNSSGTITESRFTGNYTALYVKDRAKPVFVDNELRNNTIGVQIRGEARPVIKDNLIQENRGNGIAIYDMAQPKISGNRILLNKSNGLFFKASNFNGTIKSNEILDNKDFGVSLQGESRPSLEDNIIKGNGLGGLQYKDAAQGVLRKNKILGNKYGGIKIVDRAKPTLTANKILNNQGDGIEIMDKAQPMVNSNEISQNSGDGISLLLNEPGGLLTNNICTGNRGYGISILKKSEPALTNNTYKGNHEGTIFRQETSQN